MKGKIVATILFAIFLVTVTLPLFVDVSGEVSRIWIKNIDMKLKKVNESHAEIVFIIELSGKANATLLTKVYDMKTNLLLKEIEKRVETSELNLTISFEKDKNYNIEFQLLVDGKVADKRGLSVRGLSTLIPKDKELKLNLKDADFEISNVTTEKVKVRALFYIESLRDYNDTIFHVKAVQFESNILADEKWIAEEIRKGKTQIIECNLTVPKDYNYLIKIEAWRNGSLLKSWSEPLNLAPTRKIPQNYTEEPVRFEVSEFIKPETPVEYGVDYTRELPKAAPGFEVVLALLALGGVILWKRKK